MLFTAKAKQLNIADSGKSDDAVFNTHRLIILAMFLFYTAMLVAGTLMITLRRPLWTDELFTYYIATLPSFRDVWSALMTGHDQIPLGFYAVERLALEVLGVNSAAIRLPALLGCLVMTLALFSFVSRRLTPAYGLLAAMFPMITTAYEYAREARPYGLELGLGALALLSWQRATESGNRLLALLGLWLSLVAAISCHYYGVLLVLPLAFGELLRSITRKRIDFWILACLAGSILPLFPMLPLILSAAKLSGDFWARPNWFDIPVFYRDLMEMTAFPLIVVVTFGIVASRFVRKSSVIDPGTIETGFPSHELGAIVGFAALPFAGVLVAKFVTHAFTDRYVLSAVVGLSALFAQTMYIILRNNFRLVATIAFFVLAWFAVLEVREARSAAHFRHRLDASRALLRAADKEGLPIVISDLHAFIELSHYSQPDIASHLIYLADPVYARKLIGVGSLDRGMLELVGPWFHMNVAPFEQFAKSHVRFLMYGYSQHRFSWIMPALKERGFRIQFQSANESMSLFTVDRPDR